jgi:collagen triple helix repeat protein
VAKSANSDRGRQGIPGPPGPAGPIGSPGAQGRAGQRGATGKTGMRGAKGSVGPKGGKGQHGAKGEMGEEPPRRVKLLDIVQVQISRIDEELRIQMTRMGQIQAEVDQLRANLRRLAGDPHSSSNRSPAR